MLECVLGTMEARRGRHRWAMEDPTQQPPDRDKQKKDGCSWVQSAKFQLLDQKKWLHIDQL